MSSEALREAFDWLEAISSADPKLVRPSGLAAAMLAEVARLEQELATVERVSQRNANAHMAVHRALAVAREREQRAVDALQDAEWNGSAWIGLETCPVCGNERVTGHTGDCSVAAALVDEPAAAAALPHQALGRCRCGACHTLEEAIALNGGPGSASAAADEPASAVVWSEPRQDFPGGRVYRDGLATGTPGAAADEPGETPT